MAAQPQQNKPQEVIINLKAEVQKLKEMRDAIELMKQEGKLANVNENTYRALFNQIEQTIKRMNEGIRDGAIGASGLKSIQRGFESITSSIGKMVSQEKSTGMGLTEYNKKLEEAEKTVRDQIAAIEELKKKQKELSVTEKGNPKRGQEGQIMAAARKASRAERGNKGGDTKAEALLKGGDLKGIQEGAAAGDPAATKALQLYNKELERQAGEWAELTDKIGEAKEQLSQYKATLSEIKSMGAFDEKAVDDLGKMGEQAGATANSLKTTQTEMEKTNTASIKVSSGMKKVESSAAKAAKTFIKFNVVVKLARQVLKQGIDAVVEMDKALTDMAIVTGKSRSELQAMIPTFNKLGRETGATATEVAGLTAEYMKQGRTMKDSIALAEQTAKAAKISGLSAAETTEYLTATINGFNMAAKDAAHVNDVFAKLGASTATDYQDLAIALSKVSAQANTAGMSMEFTTTLLAKGLETTQEAPESIGTALKTVLARMRELSDYGATLEDGMSVNKVERALAAVGVELRDTNGQFRDMEEIFQELGPQWENLDTMQQQAIAQAVAGTRQQSRFLAIMQDWDRTLEMSSAALDADGAAMYQHAQYAESLEFSINKLQTAWQGFVSALTDSDLVRNTFSFIADVMSKLVDLLNFLNNISGGLLGTGTTLAAVGWVLVSIIKERIQAHREETELRQRQLEILKEEQAAQAAGITGEKAKTGELEKQLSLRQQLKAAEDEEYKTFKERLAESIAAGAEQGKQNVTDRRERRDAKQREASLKKMQKLEKKAQKEKEKGSKKFSKTEKKREKELSKFRDKENKRLKKAKDEQIAIARQQKSVEEEIRLKMADQAISEEEKAKLAQQLQLQSAARKTTEQNIAQISEQQKVLDQATVATKTSELAIDQQDAAVNAINAQIEEQTTGEEGEQVLVKSAGLGIEKAENAEKGKGLMLSIKERLEDTKDVIVKAAGAFAEAVKSLGVPAGPIAGAAILAIIGGIIGVGLAASGGNLSSGDRDEKMAENQNAIYETKQKKADILQYRDEYAELNKKTFKTQEEIDRMAEIEEALKELDENITGTGDGLLESIDRQTEILDGQLNSLIDTNFMYASKNASKGDLSDETKLAMRQKAQQEVEKTLSGDSELSDADKNSINSAVQNMVGNMTAEDYSAIFDKEMTKEDKEEAKKAKKARKQEIKDEKAALKEKYKNGEITKEEWKEAKKRLKAEKKSLTNDSMFDEKNYQEMLNQVTSATTAIYKAEGQDLATQIATYNQSLEGLDETARAMVEKQFGDLAMLSKYEDSVREIVDNKTLGIADSGIRNFAKTLNEAGASAEGFATALGAISEDGFSGLLNMSDEDWKNIIDPNDPDFHAKKQKLLLQALHDLTGIDSNGLKDARTNLESQAENVNDLQGKLISGDKLSQEDEEYLANNFADLWANADFQASLAGDGVAAAKMIEQAQADSRQGTIAQGEALIQGEKDLLQSEYGMSFDQLAQMSKEELEAQFSKDGASDIINRIGQIYTDQKNLDGIRDFKYEYEGLNAEAQELEEATARYDALQKEIDKKGLGTLGDYEALRDAAQTVADINEEHLQSTVDKLKSTLGEDVVDSILTINKETGEVLVDMDKYAELSGVEKEIFDAQLETIKEQNQALADQLDTLEEINEMEREAQLEIQNQALEAMKARLDAEYEATQKSLEKRQELYSKYFDALDAEEESENYENDRQALLNKIAALSTATDSESLAQLKEAQEELKELDDEQLQNERDMRREAVEESFEKQGEDLDAAYEDAMANVQGLWEEFCTMAGEDQLELFRQYGDGFQEVTDLQRQIAEETLANTMAAIGSYGLSGQASGSTPAFAEGGLVDYTGPAWVDGTKSRPEAFLDAVDTANIANLAQGLRALVTGSIGMNGSGDASTITINELNINVNGSADGQAVGQDAADGFMKAMRELGININKQG